MQNKQQENHVKNAPSCKGAVALFLCLCLLTTSVSAAPIPSAETSALPGLSAQVGRVDETWQGQNGKTIYLIRDAHDSVAAQKNIARVIHYLVQSQGVKTVYEEGYEGEVPTDLFFQDVQDPTAREQVSRQLLEQLRIGGAEYAHINRGSWIVNSESKKRHHKPQIKNPVKQPEYKQVTIHYPRSTNHDFRLIGADSLRGHLENILDYRRAARAREEILSDLDAIQKQQDQIIVQNFPQTARQWLKLEDRFEKNQLDLEKYLRRSVQIYLDLQSQNSFTQQYPQLTLFVKALDSKNADAVRKARQIQGREFNHELRLFEAELSRALLRMGLLQKDNEPQSLVGAIPSKQPAGRHELPLRDDHDLERVYSDYQTIKLARKLAMMELSPADFADVQTLLKEFKTQAFARFAAEQNSKTVVLSRRWEKKIQRAVQFYQTALSREAAVSKHLKEFAVDSAETKAALVFGGFHAPQLKEMFREQGFSYVIVDPVIPKISKRDCSLYRQLMASDERLKMLPPPQSPLKPDVSKVQSKMSRVMSDFEWAASGLTTLTDVRREILGMASVAQGRRSGQRLAASGWGRSNVLNAQHSSRGTGSRSEVRGGVEVQTFVDDVNQVLSDISPDALLDLHVLTLLPSQNSEWQDLLGADARKLVERGLREEGFSRVTASQKDRRYEFLNPPVRLRKTKANHLYIFDARRAQIPFNAILRSIRRMVELRARLERKPNDPIVFSSAFDPALHLGDFKAWRDLEVRYPLKEKVKRVPEDTRAVEAFFEKANAVLLEAHQQGLTKYQHWLEFEPFSEQEFGALSYGAQEGFFTLDQVVVENTRFAKQQEQWLEGGFILAGTEFSGISDEESKVPAPQRLRHFFYVSQYTEKVDLPALLELVQGIIRGEENSAKNSTPAVLESFQPWLDLKREYPSVNAEARWNPYFFWDLHGHLFALIRKASVTSDSHSEVITALKNLRDLKILAARSEIEMALKSERELSRKEHLESALIALDKVLSGRYGWFAFLIEHKTLSLLLLFSCSDLALPLITAVLFFIHGGLGLFAHPLFWDSLAAGSLMALAGLGVAIIFGYLMYRTPIPQAAELSETSNEVLNILKTLPPGDDTYTRDLLIAGLIENKNIPQSRKLLSDANNAIRRNENQQQSLENRIVVPAGLVLLAAGIGFALSLLDIFRLEQNGQANILSMTIAFRGAILSAIPAYILRRYYVGRRRLLHNNELFLSALKGKTAAWLTELGAPTDIHYREPGRSEVRTNSTELDRSYEELLAKVRDTADAGKLETRERSLVNHVLSRLVPIASERDLTKDQVVVSRLWSDENRTKENFPSLWKYQGIDKDGKITMIPLSHAPEIRANFLFSEPALIFRQAAQNQLVMQLTRVEAALSLPSEITSLTRKKLIENHSHGEIHDLAVMVNRTLKGQKIESQGAFSFGRAAVITEQDVISSQDYGNYARTVRLGPLVFIALPWMNLPVLADQLIELRKKIKDVYPEMQGNIFAFTPSFYIRNSELMQNPLSRFEQLLFAQMLDKKEIFENATVVEFGGGNGLPARVAAGLGARVVYIEREKLESEIAKLHFKAEGWKEIKTLSEKGDYAVLNLDFSTAAFDQWAGDNELGEKADIAIMNIGPWAFYGQANDTALEKAAAWKHLRLILNGGFYLAHPEHVEAMRKAKTFLESQGFNVKISKLSGVGMLIASRAGLRSEVRLPNTGRSEVRTNPAAVDWVKELQDVAIRKRLGNLPGLDVETHTKKDWRTGRFDSNNQNRRFHKVTAHVALPGGGKILASEAVSDVDEREAQQQAAQSLVKKIERKFPQPLAAEAPAEFPVLVEGDNFMLPLVRLLRSLRWAPPEYEGIARGEKFVQMRISVRVPGESEPLIVFSKLARQETAGPVSLSNQAARKMLLAIAERYPELKREVWPLRELTGVISYKATASFFAARRHYHMDYQAQRFEGDAGQAGVQRGRGTLTLSREDGASFTGAAEGNLASVQIEAFRDLVQKLPLAQQFSTVPALTSDADLESLWAPWQGMDALEVGFPVYVFERAARDRAQAPTDHWRGELQRFVEENYFANDPGFVVEQVREGSPGVGRPRTYYNVSLTLIYGNRNNEHLYFDQFFLREEDVESAQEALAERLLQELQNIKLHNRPVYEALQTPGLPIPVQGFNLEAAADEIAVRLGWKLPHYELRFDENGRFMETRLIQERWALEKGQRKKGQGFAVAPVRAHKGAYDRFIYMQTEAAFHYLQILANGPFTASFFEAGSEKRWKPWRGHNKEGGFDDVWSVRFWARARRHRVLDTLQTADGRVTGYVQLLNESGGVAHEVSAGQIVRSAPPAGEMTLEIVRAKAYEALVRQLDIRPSELIAEEAAILRQNYAHPVKDQRVRYKPWAFFKSLKLPDDGTTHAIRSPLKHGDRIALDSLPPAVREFMEAAKAHKGRQFVLLGGALRKALLHQGHWDTFDFSDYDGNAVIALWPEEKRLLYSSEHPVPVEKARLVFGWDSAALKALSGRIREGMTEFRESLDPMPEPARPHHWGMFQGRPVEQAFGIIVTRHGDFLRALPELSINSMGLSMDGVFIDPWGGYQDLQNKTARFVGPLQKMHVSTILRGFRFKQALGLKWHPESEALLREMARQLKERLSTGQHPIRLLKKRQAMTAVWTHDLEALFRDAADPRAAYQELKSFGFANLIERLGVPVQQTLAAELAHRSEVRVPKPELIPRAKIPRLLRSALARKNSRARKLLLKTYGPKSKGVRVRLDEQGRVSLFRIKVKGKEKKVYLALREYPRMLLRLRFSKDKQGHIWMQVHSAVHNMLLLETFYDTKNRQFIAGREHFKQKTLRGDAIPGMKISVPFERQENNSAHNYFAFKYLGKTYNLTRPMDARYKGIAADPELAVVHVIKRETSGGRSLDYGFMDAYEDDIAYAFARWQWQWNAEKGRYEFKNIFFRVPGTKIWFYDFLKGKLSVRGLYFLRADLDKKGSVLIHKGLELRLGDLYKGTESSMPETVLMVNSAMEKNRVDIYEPHAGELNRERGRFVPARHRWITSKFYNPKTKLLERPWQELTRRYRSYRKSGGLAVPPAPVVMRTLKSTARRAGAQPTRIFLDPQNRPVLFQSHRFEGRLVMVRFTDFVYKDEHRRGVEVIALDEHFDPQELIKKGFYDEKQKRFIWFSPNKRKPFSAESKKPLQDLLVKAGYYEGYFVRQAKEAGVMLKALQKKLFEHPGWEKDPPDFLHEEYNRILDFIEPVKEQAFDLRMSTPELDAVFETLRQLAAPLYASAKDRVVEASHSLAEGLIVNYQGRIGRIVSLQFSEANFQTVTIAFEDVKHRPSPEDRVETYRVSAILPELRVARPRSEMRSADIDKSGPEAVSWKTILGLFQKNLGGQRVDAWKKAAMKLPESSTLSLLSLLTAQFTEAGTLAGYDPYVLTPLPSLMRSIGAKNRTSRRVLEKIAAILNQMQVTENNKDMAKTAKKTIARWITQLPALPKTGEGILEPISELDSDAILKEAEIHGSTYRDRALEIDDIKRLDMQPRFKITVEGRTYYLPRQVYDLDKDGRLGILAFVQDDLRAGETGPVTRTVARSYYRSNSHGGAWRYLPTVLSYDGGQHIAWFDKGFNEDSIGVPYQILKAIQQIRFEHGIAIIENETDRERLFAGTTRVRGAKPREGDEREAGHTYMAVVAPNGKVLNDGSHSIVGRFGKTPPGKVLISHPDEAPDFKNLIGEFEMETSLSTDGIPDRLRWSRASDKKEVIKIGAVRNDAETQKINLRDGSELFFIKNQAEYAPEILKRTGKASVEFSFEDSTESDPRGQIVRNSRPKISMIASEGAQQDYPAREEKHLWLVETPQGKYIFDQHRHLIRIEYSGGNKLELDYGIATARVFDSYDGKLRYVFVTDKFNHSMDATIEVKGAVTAVGLHSQWPKAGSITTPLHDYREQAEIYGDPAVVKDRYVSMWRNYLRHVALIQEFHRHYVGDIEIDEPAPRSWNEDESEPLEENPAPAAPAVIVPAMPVWPHPTPQQNVAETGLTQVLWNDHRAKWPIPAVQPGLPDVERENASRSAKMSLGSVVAIGADIRDYGGLNLHEVSTNRNISVPLQQMQQGIKVVLGRAVHAIQFDHGTVSRIHAELSFEVATEANSHTHTVKVYVKDLGSQNGTFVDGDPITPNQRVLLVKRTITLRSEVRTDDSPNRPGGASDRSGLSAVVNGLLRGPVREQVRAIQIYVRSSLEAADHDQMLFVESVLEGVIQKASRGRLLSRRVLWTTRAGLFKTRWHLGRYRIKLWDSKKYEDGGAAVLYALGFMAAAFIVGLAVITWRHRNDGKDLETPPLHVLKQDDDSEEQRARAETRRIARAKMRIGTDASALQAEPKLDISPSLLPRKQGGRSEMRSTAVPAEIAAIFEKRHKDEGDWKKLQGYVASRLPQNMEPAAAKAMTSLLIRRRQTREEWLKLLRFFVSLLPEEPRLRRIRWEPEVHELFKKPKKSTEDWKQILRLLKAKLPEGSAPTFRNLARLSGLFTAQDILRAMLRHQLSFSEWHIQRWSPADATLTNVAGVAQVYYFNRNQISDALKGHSISEEEAGMVEERGTPQSKEKWLAMFNRRKKKMAADGVKVSRDEFAYDMGYENPNIFTADARRYRVPREELLAVIELPRSTTEPKAVKKARFEAALKAAVLDAKERTPGISGRDLLLASARKMKYKYATGFYRRARQLGVHFEDFNLETPVPADPPFRLSAGRAWLRENLTRGLSDAEKKDWIASVFQLVDFEAVSMTPAYATIQAVRSGQSTIKGLDEAVARDLSLNSTTVSELLTGSTVSETAQRSANIYDFLARSLNKKLALERDYPREGREGAIIAWPLMHKYAFPYFVRKLLESPETAHAARDIFEQTLRDWTMLNPDDEEILYGVLQRGEKYAVIGTGLHPRLSTEEVRARLYGKEDILDETGLFARLREQIRSSGVNEAGYQNLLIRAGLREDAAGWPFIAWMMTRRPFPDSIRRTLGKLAIYDVDHLPKLRLWPGKTVSVEGRLGVLNAWFRSLTTKEIAADAAKIMNDETLTNFQVDYKQLKRWFAGDVPARRASQGALLKLRDALLEKSMVRAARRQFPIYDKLAEKILAENPDDFEILKQIELIEKRRTPTTIFLKTAAAIAEDLSPLLLNPIRQALARIYEHPEMELDHYAIIDGFADGIIRNADRPGYLMSFFAIMLETGYHLKRRLSPQVLQKFLTGLLKMTYPSPTAIEGADTLSEAYRKIVESYGETRVGRHLLLPVFLKAVQDRPKNLYMRGIYRRIMEDLYVPVMILPDKKAERLTQLKHAVPESRLFDLAAFENALQDHQRRLKQQTAILEEFLGNSDDQEGLWPIDMIASHILRKYPFMLRARPDNPRKILNPGGMEMEDLLAEARQVLSQAAYVYNDPVFGRPILDPEERGNIIRFLETQLEESRAVIDKLNTDIETLPASAGKVVLKRMRQKLANQQAKKEMYETALRAQKLLTAAAAEQNSAKQTMLEDSAQSFFQMIRTHYLDTYRQSHVVALFISRLSWRLQKVFKEHRRQRDAVLAGAVSLNQGGANDETDDMAGQVTSEQADLRAHEFTAQIREPEIRERLLRAIQIALHPRDQTVLRLRFGLDPAYEGMHLEYQDVAQILAYRAIPGPRGDEVRVISQQRVRQILNASISLVTDAVLALASAEQGALFDRYLENLGVIGMEEPEPVAVRISEEGTLKLGKWINLSGLKNLAGQTLGIQISDAVRLDVPPQERAQLALDKNLRRIFPYNVQLTLREGARVQAVYSVNILRQTDGSLRFGKTELISRNPRSGPDANHRGTPRRLDDARSEMRSWSAQKIPGEVPAASFAAQDYPEWLQHAFKQAFAELDRLEKIITVETSDSGWKKSDVFFEAQDIADLRSVLEKLIHSGVSLADWRDFNRRQASMADSFLAALKAHWEYVARATAEEMVKRGELERSQFRKHTSEAAFNFTKNRKRFDDSFMRLAANVNAAFLFLRLKDAKTLQMFEQNVQGDLARIKPGIENRQALQHKIQEAFSRQLRPVLKYERQEFSLAEDVLDQFQQPWMERYLPAIGTKIFSAAMDKKKLENLAQVIPPQSSSALPRRWVEELILELVGMIQSEQADPTPERLANRRQAYRLLEQARPLFVPHPDLKRRFAGYFERASLYTQAAGFSYYAIYKPEGVSSDFEAPDSQTTTVHQLFHEQTGLDPKKFFIIGYLPFYTEGLLILTDDPGAAALVGYGTTLPEQLEVKVRGRFTAAAADQARHGLSVEIETVRGKETIVTSSFTIQIQSASDQESILQITLPKGYAGHVDNVNTVLRKLGFNILHKKRLALGALSLDQESLQPGEIRAFNGVLLENILMAKAASEEYLTGFAETAPYFTVRKFRDMLLYQEPMIRAYAKAHLEKLLLNPATQKSVVLALLKMAVFKERAFHDRAREIILDFAGRFPGEVVPHVLSLLEDRSWKLDRMALQAFHQLWQTQEPTSVMAQTIVRNLVDAVWQTANAAGRSEVRSAKAGITKGDIISGRTPGLYLPRKVLPYEILVVLALATLEPMLFLTAFLMALDAATLYSFWKFRFFRYRHWTIPQRQKFIRVYQGLRWLNIAGMIGGSTFYVTGTNHDGILGVVGLFLQAFIYFGMAHNHYVAVEHKPNGGFVGRELAKLNRRIKRSIAREKSEVPLNRSEMRSAIPTEFQRLGDLNLAAGQSVIRQRGDLWDDELRRYIFSSESTVDVWATVERLRKHGVFSKTKKIADLGSGLGWIVNAFNQQTRAEKIDITGFEIDPYLMDEARRLSGDFAAEHLIEPARNHWRQESYLSDDVNLAEYDLLYLFLPLLRGGQPTDSERRVSGSTSFDLRIVRRMKPGALLVVSEQQLEQIREVLRQEAQDIIEYDEELKAFRRIGEPYEKQMESSLELLSKELDVMEKALPSNVYKYVGKTGALFDIPRAYRTARLNDLIQRALSHAFWAAMYLARALFPSELARGLVLKEDQKQNWLTSALPATAFLLRNRDLKSLNTKQVQRLQQVLLEGSLFEIAETADMAQTLRRFVDDPELELPARGKALVHVIAGLNQIHKVGNADYVQRRMNHQVAPDEEWAVVKTLAYQAIALASRPTELWSEDREDDLFAEMIRSTGRYLGQSFDEDYVLQGRAIWAATFRITALPENLLAAVEREDKAAVYNLAAIAVLFHKELASLSGKYHAIPLLDKLATFDALNTFLLPHHAFFREDLFPGLRQRVAARLAKRSEVRQQKTAIQGTSIFQELRKKPDSDVSRRDFETASSQAPFRRVLIDYRDVEKNFKKRRLIALAKTAAEHPQTKFIIYRMKPASKRLLRLKRLFKGMTNVVWQTSLPSDLLEGKDEEPKDSRSDGTLHLSTFGFDIAKRFGERPVKVMFMKTGHRPGAIAAALAYDPNQRIFAAVTEDPYGFLAIGPSLARLGQRWLSDLVIGQAA